MLEIVTLFIKICFHIAGLVSPSPNDECTLMADAVHAEAIRHALSEVAASSNDEAGCSRPRPRGGGWTSSEDEAEEMDHDIEGDCDRPVVSVLPPGRPFADCGNLAAYGTSLVDLIASHIHDQILGHIDYIEDGFESNGRRWSFEEQRRAHYDEYRKAKMLNGQEISDEDDNHIGEHHRDRHLLVGSSSRSNQDQEANLSRSLSGIDLEETQQ
ncbi:protein phosphatase inhibitor 2 [Marchantia polymorpha subsp. ruderalis]|uniref:Uncharacterized protein n=1 Tax=Marchantia polymorpha TaxID=3197 RepID=A0A2R6XB88_MARPO|nr:hypothetical protein MARPO_0025s0030 [Marchantia polymorpha]PTQ43332.1 hypothetical protein MARPO_0025s0030 [Marchantia polymorpha]BBN03804.1 hypothetical protein Mp_2g26540 [Marchantia polymorpha subsp. ruderalis]BBN03805.1 hypothetical protein Mp_2g26540 [Marchantia polymorpha subsp. ruderalis]|eukprot:PTQ43331.1 hypothetical protein MARPO_0025s0030 [Marchantia polymorpha]